MEVITMDTQPLLGLRRHEIVSINLPLSLRVSGWNILSCILGYFARDKY